MFCTNCGAQIGDDFKYCSECAHPVNGVKNPQSTMSDLAPITGLRLNYVAYRSHFRFSLKEKDGVVLFSCNYFKEGFGDIIQEDVSVDSAYMRELREFVQKNDYIHLKDNDPSTREYRDSDEPDCNLTLEWEDYRSLLIRSTKLPPNGGELREFFKRIAEDAR